MHAPPRVARHVGNPSLQVLPLARLENAGGLEHVTAGQRSGDAMLAAFVSPIRRRTDPKRRRAELARRSRPLPTMTSGPTIPPG
jgi:hypothetical protein